MFNDHEENHVALNPKFVISIRMVYLLLLDILPEWENIKNKQDWTENRTLLNSMLNFSGG